MHELRAASDAVAVGMGTVRADAPASRRARRPRARASRDASRSGAARSRTAPSSSCGRGPLGRSSRRSRRRASSRCCSRAGRRSRRRSSRRTSSTSSCVFVAPTIAGAGPQLLGELERPVALTPHDGAAGRRRRPARGVRPRAVSRRRRAASLSSCSRESCARSGRVASVDGGDDGVALVVEAPGDGGRRRGRRLGRDRRRLPDGGVGRRRAACAFHAVPETLRRSSLGRLAAGCARQPRAGAARRRAARAATTCRATSTASARVRAVEPEGEGVRVRRRGAWPSCCATASRRARSRSRASR